MRRVLASLVAVFIGSFGCGSDPADPTGDGGPAVDAAPPATEVTVRVVSGSQPAAGIHVVFQDAAGEVLAAAISGPGGLASHELTSGGMVTVVAPSARISTFTGVEPGDQLTFDVTPRGNPAGVAEIQLPSPIATANRFEISTGCSKQVVTSTALPVSLAINSSCIDADGQMAAVVLAFEVDEANNDEFVALHGVSAIRDQPVSGSGASFALPAFAAVDSNFELTLAGAIVPRALLVGEVVGEIVFGRQFITALSPVTVPVATSISDRLQYTVSWALPDLALPGGTLARSQLNFARIGNAMTAQSLDTDVDGLAEITSVELDATDRFRPSIRYASAASASADLWIASVAWSQGNAGQSWDLIAPADVLEVTVPALPGYLEPRWQPPTPNLMTAGAIVAELSEIADYDAARTGPGFSTYTSSTPPLGGEGSFVKASVATLAPIAAGARRGHPWPAAWLFPTIRRQLR